MKLSEQKIEKILEYNNHLKENDRLSIEDTHEKIRSILIDYGSQEYGDSIVDEICQLFDFPTTIDINPEED